tara:strand:+ start:557 stop:871 length:315 start_codon:yes stop_codon:yes gene_type:complete
MIKHIGVNTDKNYMKMLALLTFSLFLTSCGDEMRVRRNSASGNANALSVEGCAAIYKPVCGQPPMPVCAPGIFCAMVMPAPKTYDNECQMDKSGATLISEGECL